MPDAPTVTDHVLAVDWGKDVAKRCAYLGDVRGRRVHRLDVEPRLATLLDFARGLDGRVLVGVDAALGMPRTTWERLCADLPAAPPHFGDFLSPEQVPEEFFEPVRTPADWSPRRPFVRPPAGKWSLREFERASGDGLRRAVDRRLHANPVFVTSGLPGSVGSGTSMLWQELVAAAHDAPLRVWPFHGRLDRLSQHGTPVVAEIYPRACYGLALDETLPARLRSIAKTKPGPRRDALEALLACRWLQDLGLHIENLDEAAASEDAFDAMVSATALTRLVLEGAPLEDDECDAVAEGGILGAASLTRAPEPRAHRGRAAASPVHARAAERPRAERASPGEGEQPRPLPPRKEEHGKRRHPCPIPGCDHVFSGSRRGWDAHVVSPERHPDWHPDVVGGTERKTLFRAEFAAWFE